MSTRLERKKSEKKENADILVSDSVEINRIKKRADGSSQRCETGLPKEGWRDSEPLKLPLWSVSAQKWTRTACWRVRAVPSGHLRPRQAGEPHSAEAGPLLSSTSPSFGILKVSDQWSEESWSPCWCSLSEPGAAASGVSSLVSKDGGVGDHGLRSISSEFLPYL